MENSNLVWNLHEKQLSISGFRKFEKARIEGIFEEDIWDRDIVVAESGLIDMQKTIKEGKPLTLFVGYSPGRPHLGYILMNRFLKSFRRYDSTKIILGINIKESMETHNRTLEETLKSNELVERALLGDNTREITRVYDLSFLNDLSIQKLHNEIYSRVVRELTFVDFNKIMGWDEKTPLSQYESTCRAISGMLYAPAQNQGSSSLSFTDIKHLPFVRLTKKVSKKLSIKEPSFLVTTALPSLTDETQRMSSIGGDSTIYLFSEVEELDKYLKVRSGGRPKEEQMTYGGRPDSCLALKIASYIISSHETERTISECTSGTRDSCRECKKLMANYMNHEMNSL